MTKYKISTWNDTKIEAVEVERETDKCVWVKWTMGANDRLHKELKNTESHDYFDSWDDALAILLVRAEIRLENARVRLQQAQGTYGNVKGMKNPEQAVVAQD